MFGHVYDVFMFNDELDILECRLYELQDIPNLTHVIVEANVTHQDNPKDSVFLDHRERFAPWKDRIAHVRSEEHTSELQSHSFISYAVFCLKKKKKKQYEHSETNVSHSSDALTRSRRL